MRISDWSSDVCSSDLRRTGADAHPPRPGAAPRSAALLMRPTNEDEVRDAIAEAIRSGATLDIRGGGSKAAIGAPRPEATVLALSSIAGVVDYDPAELVLKIVRASCRERVCQAV